MILKIASGPRFLHRKMDTDFLGTLPYHAAMRVIVAPDSFKGTLSAPEAAEAMAAGIRSVMPAADIDLIPVADGGEGTTEVLVKATGGRLREHEVLGPLGNPVRATWGILGDGRTAVVETASASGWRLVPADRRNPGFTTTYGTGELILAALDAGVKRIIVGLGGSGTNDGGAGMAEALGARLLDGQGRQLARGGEALLGLKRIDLTALDRRLSAVEIIGACDVANPLLGPEGASLVYGPQKGATPDQARVLDEALGILSAVLRHQTGLDVSAIRGGGAAGGLGAGLAAFLNARLTRGIDLVLDAVGFDERIAGADAIVTGEGSLDRQWKYGKALQGVLERASRAGIPVYAIAGIIEGPASVYTGPGGFAGVTSLVGAGVTRLEAERRARELLRLQTAALLTPRATPDA